MRTVIKHICVFGWLALALPAYSSTAPSRFHNGVTLLLQFDDQPAPERVLAEAARELNSIMKNAGAVIELRLFKKLSAYEEFADLVVVRLKGDCKLDVRPARRSDAGPLAFAHTSDGQVLPFMEIHCDRVKAAIRPVLWGDQFRRTDELMARALARVMAHELYHIFGQTCKHSDEGIARHSLTGPDLIGDELDFQPEDVEKILSGQD